MREKFMNIARTILSTFILTASFQSFAKIEAVIEIFPLKQNPNLIKTIPETKESEIIISRDQYVVSFNKNTRTPNWVSWKLEKTNFGNSGRTNNFQKDTDLENYFSEHDQKFHAVDTTEYKGSCFDRGHQVPSADRTANVEDNSSTFYMTNMVPQTAYLNRTIWENLESYTRDLVKTQNKKVYIIAGPIYDDNYGSIGPNKDIKVPSKAFKVVFILNENQTADDININTPSISVIMPNTLKDGSKPDFSNGCKTVSDETTVQNLAKSEWTKYQTTLGQVQKESGLKIIE